MEEETWRYHEDCPGDDLNVPEAPHYDDLTDTQKLAFGNGVGPDWIPESLRSLITGYASWFFAEASWKHHDFGYAKGRTEAERARYDRLFLEAMRRDASRYYWPKWLLALLVSSFFHRAVRRYGSRSFFYCNRYRTLEEVIATIGTGRRSYEHVMPDGMQRGWEGDKQRALRECGR